MRCRYMDEWITDMEECPSSLIDMTWWDELALGDPYIKVVSEPEFYKRPGSQSYHVVYRADGVILKYICST